MATSSMHVMPDGTMMSNTEGMHVMPDGTMMADAEMQALGPAPAPRELDPFIASLCSAIEAAQTTEITAMEGWLSDQGLVAEAPCLPEEAPEGGGGMEMMMGCGQTDCTSTSMYMAENMAMHQGMAIEFTGDPEIDFVLGMIPHHEGAVEMCAIARQTSGTPNGRGGETIPALDTFIDTLCTDVETGQNAEIQSMTDWLATKGVSASTTCEGSDSQRVVMGMVMGCGETGSMSSQLFMSENMAMHHGMAIDFTCDPGVDFIRGMIPHHRGAVEMCNIVRATVTGDYSLLGAGVHTMPDGTVMATSSMHVMPDGTMMADAEMQALGPAPAPRELDPFIASLCSAIEAAQTTEITAMGGWLSDQ